MLETGNTEADSESIIHSLLNSFIHYYAKKPQKQTNKHFAVQKENKTKQMERWVDEWLAR